MTTPLEKFGGCCVTTAIEALGTLEMIQTFWSSLEYIFCLVEKTPRLTSIWNGTAKKACEHGDVDYG